MDADAAPVMNQSAAGVLRQESDDHGRMKDSTFRDRVVDVAEEPLH
jgi:hypothetical protein